MTTDKNGTQDEELKKDNRVRDTDTDATIQRGQEAIKADQLIDPDNAQERQKDAEQWRNEG